MCLVLIILARVAILKAGTSCRNTSLRHLVLKHLSKMADLIRLLNSFIFSRYAEYIFWFMIFRVFLWKAWWVKNPCCLLTSPPNSPAHLTALTSPLASTALGTSRSSLRSPGARGNTGGVEGRGNTGGAGEKQGKDRWVNIFYYYLPLQNYIFSSISV